MPWIARAQPAPPTQTAPPDAPPAQTAPPDAPPAPPAPETAPVETPADADSEPRKDEEPEKAEKKKQKKKKKKSKAPHVSGFFQMFYRYSFFTSTDGMVDAPNFRVQRVRVAVDGDINHYLAYDISIDPRAP